MKHFGKISKTLGKHLEAVKSTKGYHSDPIFSEVWRVLNVNSAKDSGGIFDAIVQAKFRQMDEFLYEDRTGKTAPFHRAHPAGRRIEHYLPSFICSIYS